MTLLLSLFALFLGPAIYWLVEKKRQVMNLIDGFAFVALSGLILAHFLPLVLEEGDIWLVVLMLLGFLGPNALEKWLDRSGEKVHRAVLLVGLLGFLFHAMTDGAALVPHHGSSSGTGLLIVAVIIHRFLEGLSLWWLVRPDFGPVSALIVVCAVAAASIGGFATGEALLSVSSPHAAQLFQAFVAGTILHVVIFRLHVHHPQAEDSCCEHHDHKPDRGSKAYEILGNLLGFALLLTALQSHFKDHSDHSHQHSAMSGESFLGFAYSLFSQSALALLLAFFLASLLYGFFELSPSGWFARGNRLIQALKGVLFGLPMPVCSCGVLPLYRTVVEKGLPPAAALALLIATPELGLDAIILSIPLLGMEMSIVRVGGAVIFALVVALVLAPYSSTRKSLAVVEESPPLTFLEKLRKGFRFGLIELVDTTAPWILLGIGVAAVLAPLLSNYPLLLPYHLEIVLFSAVGIIIYVCASGATPMVAVFLASGLSPGAALAFLLTGPATNISTFGVLAKLHGRNFALGFMVTAVIAAVALGYLVTWSLPDITRPSIASLEHHHSNLLHDLASIAVGLLFLFSLLRQGARGFVGEIFGQEDKH